MFIQISLAFPLVSVLPSRTQSWRPHSVWSAHFLHVLSSVLGPQVLTHWQFEGCWLGTARPSSVWFCLTFSSWLDRGHGSWWRAKRSYHSEVHVWGTFLLSGTGRCSRLILYIHCPSPRISHVSKDPDSFFWTTVLGTVVRMVARCACCHWMMLIFKQIT